MYELADLALESLRYRVRPFFLLGLLAQLVDVLSLVHAQLFLNGAELIVQVVLPLLLVHFGADLALYVVLEFENLNLTVKHLNEFHGPDLEIALFQKLYFLHGVFYLDTGGDEIDKKLVSLQVLDGECRFLGKVRGELDDVQCQILDRSGKRTHLLVVLFGKSVLKISDLREHIRL